MSLFEEAKNAREANSRTWKQERQDKLDAIKEKLITELKRGLNVRTDVARFHPEEVRTLVAFFRLEGFIVKYDDAEAYRLIEAFLEIFICEPADSNFVQATV